MPFPREHMLLQFGGRFGTTSSDAGEEWTCTLRFVSDAIGAIDNDAIGEVVWERLRETFRHEDSGVSDQARLEFGKWNRIGTNGKYVGDNTRVFYTHDANTRGGGRPVHYNPWQTSLVVTLLTNKSRGLANKGRFFLPAPTYRIDNNLGLIPEADAQRTADCWGRFLDGLGLQLGGVGSGPVVMSRGRQKGIGPGAWNYVTGVSVGRRLDVMRSRAVKVKEQPRVRQFGTF